MLDETTVIAVGQTWPDLAIEQRVFGDRAQVVDGRSLDPTDPIWSTAAGVLLGTAFKMNRDRLRGLKSCRAISRYGIGFDNVDIAAAEELGIVVSIVRDYCIDEVAEHALASAMALARALPHWDRSVRSGAWRSGVRPHMRRWSELAFGVIGFGLIGRAAADKARNLFGRVLVYDPVVQPTENDHGAGCIFVPALTDLLSAADIVSVHVPLTDDTRNLLDAAALALMKKTAIVINASRGGIVDEGALLEALQNGWLSGAALDTFVQEPLPDDSPLLREGRLLLSPHVAWLSEEAELSLRQRASEELALVLGGRMPGTPVTKANTRLSGRGA